MASLSSPYQSLGHRSMRTRTWLLVCPRTLSFRSHDEACSIVKTLWEYDNSLGYLSTFFLPASLFVAGKMPTWTPAEISTLKKTWHEKTDREIATLLDRSLYSVRSFRVRKIVRRRESHRERWKGDSGRNLSRLIATEYKHGSSQTDLVRKYRIEWLKLKHILASYKLKIRGKSQQAFREKYGKDPTTSSRMTASKLYIIFAMFGDGLRPTTQTRRNTHIIGIAAGKDRDFAENWISTFEQEYGVKPSLTILGKNNIQASISSLDMWKDLHRYAIFGTRSWRFHDSTFQYLMSDRVSLSTLGHGLQGLFDADGSVKYQVKKGVETGHRQLCEFHRS
jgi:hypothetical protein